MSSSSSRRLRRPERSSSWMETDREGEGAEGGGEEGGGRSAAPVAAAAILRFASRTSSSCRVSSSSEMRLPGTPPHVVADRTTEVQAGGGAAIASLPLLLVLATESSRNQADEALVIVEVLDAAEVLECLHVTAPTGGVMSTAWTRRAGRRTESWAVAGGRRFFPGGRHFYFLFSFLFCSFP